MLGIEDDYNICLHPLEVVQAICEICMRYVFTPLLQLESSRMDKMYNAIMDGIGYYIPHSSYGSVLFFVRRLVGIPGYHYITDTPNFNFAKHYFSDEEFEFFSKNFKKHPHFAHFSGLVGAKKTYLINVVNTSLKKTYIKPKSNIDNPSDIFDMEALLEILELNSAKDISFIEVNSDNYKEICEQSKFYRLQERDQVLVIKSLDLNETMSSTLSKFLLKIVANVFFTYMFWGAGKPRKAKK
jgi:hypothetical protein